MIRRIIFSFAAASSALLSMAAVSPAHAVVTPEITFQAPAVKIKHVTHCKTGMPPCDTFKVVAQFQVTNDVDLTDDLSNRRVAVAFGLGSVCDSKNLNLVYEWDVVAGDMSKKTTASSVKYSFKGAAPAIDFGVGATTSELSLSITINNKGKGILKASGVGDLALINSSPVLFILAPYLEPDSDNDPNIADGDFNCGVASTTFVNQ